MTSLPSGLLSLPPKYLSSGASQARPTAATSYRVFAPNSPIGIAFSPKARLRLNAYGSAICPPLQHNTMVAFSAPVHVQYAPLPFSLLGESQAALISSHQHRWQSPSVAGVRVTALSFCHPTTQRALGSCQRALRESIYS